VSAAPKSWTVVLLKLSGVEVIFSSYPTKEEADLTATRLNAHGMAARVERIQAPGAVPGTTLHLPRRDKAIAR
jgi:hypothetical protein